MKRCPYCFESLDSRPSICPFCNQFLIEDLLDIDYQPTDKKKCIFCGMDILVESIICRYCHRWVDEAESNE